MTLNITVLTSELIYQSADFRLVGQPDSESSPKIVTLSYSSFIGFVTYAGIGAYANRAVSELIGGWLTEGQDLSMDNVASLLQSQGTKLVANAQRGTGMPWDMTFVLAGFEEEKPIAYVISNLYDAYGVQHALEPKLTTSSRHIKEGRKAAVIVTGGGRQFVSATDRRILGNVASRFPHDSGRIRRRLEVIHQEARETEKRKNPKDYNITPHCAVFSFRRDGSGVYQIDQSAEQLPTSFPHITFGVDTMQMALDALRAKGTDVRRLRPVQGFYASLTNTKPNSAWPPCRFTVAAPEPEAGYTLRELTSDGRELSQAISISESGIVVGTSLAQGELAQDIPWIRRENETVFIDCPGSAHAVNSAGTVALSGLGTDGKMHAGLYTPDRKLLDLHDAFYPTPAFTATSSQALAINDGGLIGGCVEDRSGEHGEINPNIRAFYTEPGRPLAVAMEPAAARHCRVVDVNQNGILLVMASMDIPSSSVRSILWNKNDRTLAYVGCQADIDIYPIAIRDSGTVLGQARNHRGQTVAVTCALGGRWKRLGTEDGWTPVDINNNGDVLGETWIEGTARPWLYLSSGKITMLPYVVSHNTRPHAINNSGQIVGSAYSDHGYHAILWDI